MIIFIYGPDTFRSSQKLKEIQDKFKEKTDPSGSNIITFTESSFDWEKFYSASTQAGFLTAKRMIILKNILTSKSKKAVTDNLLDFFKNNLKNENIFIFWENGQPDKRTSLFKLCTKNNKFAQEFTALDNRQLNKWLDDYLNQNQAKMTLSAKNLLLAFIGNNLWQLTNELDKLISYKGETEITEDDVKNLASAKAYDNIFGLTDAMANKNKKLALSLFDEQLNAGLNENYIFTMVARQFRIIAQLKNLADQNISASAMAKQTGLHPFVIQKTLPQVKKFSTEAIKKIYNLLKETDKNLKSSKLSGQTWLNLFIHHLPE